MNRYKALRSFAFPIFILLSLLARAESADLKTEKPLFETSIILREEYNDNIFLTKDNKEDDYITQVLPTIRINHESSRWLLELDCTLNAQYFAKHSNENDLSPILTGNTNLNLIKNLFFINVKDDYRKVSTDSTRDFTKESLFVNQSDRNELDINPYFLMALDPTVKLTTGYIYSNIWYREKSEVGKSDNIAYISLEVDLSPKTVLTTQYRYVQEDSDDNQLDFDSHDVFLAARYEYMEKSYFYLKIGYGRIDFKEQDSFDSVYWDANISHSFVPYRIVLETRRSYSENPGGNPLILDLYRVALEYKRERTNASLSGSVSRYTDTVTHDLTDETYGANAYIEYALTQRLTGRLEGSYDKYDDKIADTDTTRIIPGLRFDYALTEKFIVSAQYFYSYAHSPQNAPEDDYRNNRVYLELKKIF